MIENPAASHRPRHKRNPLLWLGPFLLISITLICTLVILSQGIKFSAPGSRWLPVALHSLLEADYSPYPRSVRLPGVRLDLIREALQDQSATDLSGRYATLQVSLLTPVATVTPSLLDLTSTPPFLGQTLTPTSIIATATRTLGPEASATPARTPTLTRTNTPSSTPTATGLATHTPSLPIQPTNTPKPTERKPTEPPSTKPPPTESKPTQPPPTATKPPPTEPPPEPTKEPYPPPPPSPPPPPPYP